MLGFVLIGIASGLVAGIAALLAGAGVALAVLAYVLGGLTGTGIGLALAMLELPDRKADEASA